MQKMSVCSLAEKASVNLKLCRELKLNVKIEMDCRKLKLNRLTRVAKAQQNKMADKLLESNHVLVQSLQENTKSKNSPKNKHPAKSLQVLGLKNKFI